ncbi:MAG: hypothetical protein PHI34_05750 [Acidobacteriota bacterium]|nr:hypothetical protein [Acidobacteriota bacterium]
MRFRLKLSLWLVGLLVILPLESAAQKEGVGVLFDNSGSMRQHFSAAMLEDAKQAVLDLLLKGSFDKNIWELTAQSDEYRSRKPGAIWQPGEMLYTHAFGELKSRVEPFFKVFPEFAEIKTANEARNLVESGLYSQLDFKDDFTNIDLAKYVCWWNLATQMGSFGKDFYMNVLVVSDFIPDVQKEYSGAGDRIQNTFVRNNSSQTTWFRLLHLKPSQTDPNVRLEIKVDRIGPHFIRSEAIERPAVPSEASPKPAATPEKAPPNAGAKPAPVNGTSESGRIVLKSPRRDYIITSNKSESIVFQWDAKGRFERFILEIFSIKPRRSILTQDVGDNKISRIPSRDLKAKAQVINAKELFWRVKGVYPESEAAANPSVISEQFVIRLGKPPFPFFVILLILSAIMGGVWGGKEIARRLKRPKGPNEPLSETDDSKGPDIY